MPSGHEPLLKNEPETLDYAQNPVATDADTGMSFLGKVIIFSLTLPVVIFITGLCIAAMLILDFTWY